MRDQVQEVKDKTDIVALIGEYVNLKQAGRRWKGNCPFHDEKSPSFMVSPDMQIYKCFGCGESGDVFTFLEKHEGMEFVDALKYLAQRANVILETTVTHVNRDREELLHINSLAAQFYQYLLTTHEMGKVGLTYVKEKRGLNRETMEAFQLGFAPQNPTALFSYLTRKKNIHPALTEKAGVCVAARGGYVDRFRGRIIFPIQDHHGQVVALAGRILPEFDTGKLGKYINSPETPIYHKSDSLYGLAVTKGDIKRVENAVMVEGELDLLSSWQAGVKNIVAIKGSALTEGQIRLISRYTKKVTLALDSDFAGNKAALQGILSAQKMGVTTTVTYLHPYKDPDEFARGDAEGYQKALKNSVDVWDFIIDYYFEKYDTTSGEGLSRVSSEVVPLLTQIEDEIVRARYVNKLAMRLQVEPSVILSQLARTPKATPQSLTTVQQLNPIRPPGDGRSESVRSVRERKLVGLALSEKPSFLLEPGVALLVQDQQNVEIVENLAIFLKEGVRFELKEFLKTLPENVSSYIENLILSNDEEIEELPRLVASLTKIGLEEEMERLSKDISQYEFHGDDEKLKEALSKHGELTKKRAQLVDST